MQLHGLNTLDDQGIAPPTYSDMAPKHFHFGRAKAFCLESIYLCSLLQGNSEMNLTPSPSQSLYLLMTNKPIITFKQQRHNN